MADHPLFDACAEAAAQYYGHTMSLATDRPEPAPSLLAAALDVAEGELGALTQDQRDDLVNPRTCADLVVLDLAPIAAALLDFALEHGDGELEELRSLMAGRGSP